MDCGATLATTLGVLFRFISTAVVALGGMRNVDGGGGGVLLLLLAADAAATVAFALPPIPPGDGELFDEALLPPGLVDGELVCLLLAEGLLLPLTAVIFLGDNLVPPFVLFTGSLLLKAAVLPTFGFLLEILVGFLVLLFTFTLPPSFFTLSFSLSSLFSLLSLEVSVFNSGGRSFFEKQCPMLAMK